MSKYRYETIELTGLNQGAGVRVVDVDNQADFFTVSAYGATSGSVSFEVMSVEGGEFEDLVDPQTTSKETIEFGTNTKSFIFKGYAHQFRVTPTDVVGDYTLIVQQGEN